MRSGHRAHIGAGVGRAFRSVRLDRGSVWHLRSPKKRTSAALPSAEGRGGRGVGLYFCGPQPHKCYRMVQMLVYLKSV